MPSLEVGAQTGSRPSTLTLRAGRDGRITSLNT